MSRPKAAAAGNTKRPLDYPVMDGAGYAHLNACVSASRTFTKHTFAWLKRKAPDEQAAWLKGIVAGGRTVFQPWALEVLFVLGTLGRCRFTELQNLLGVSSRTLSDKLQMLREEGFIEREVFDEQPVRIEYYLTEHGRASALLASPLMCELNRRHAERR